MSIPGYQSFMLPLLRRHADGLDHRLAEFLDPLADDFGLSPEQRSELLPSGQEPIVENRIGWARTYLKKAGLLESPRRGYTRISALGREVLASNPERIDAAYLRRFPAFLEFVAPRVPASDSGAESQAELSAGREVSEPTQTPEEQLFEVHANLQSALEHEILEQVKAASPRFFERLVVDLLVKMGYGGTLADAGQAIGRSGDGGIDGIIKEDRLGLDVIYLQAKRWDGSVGRPEIQKFAGALQGHRARKGVFLTTSSFTRDAVEYVERIDSKIVLVDGQQLARLMFEHEVGVVPSRSFVVKKLDADYFSDE